MAILGPSDLPAVLRVQSDSMKKYVMAQLGGPHVALELSEDQLEVALRVTGDFIAGYFPREQRMAVFTTTPLQSTYPLPQDAYWIQDIRWNPATTRIDDIFGIESYLFAAGSIGNVGNLLTDFHLLQAYRKFANKTLSNEGHWEVIGEVSGNSSEQLIRLYPTPKGAFPVVVVYVPIITQFRSPQAKLIAHEMLLAEATVMLGHARRKIAGMPGPDGGSIAYDGDALIQEGNKQKEEIIKKAIDLGEPMPVIVWIIGWILATCNLLF